MKYEWTALPFKSPKIQSSLAKAPLKWLVQFGQDLNSPHHVLVPLDPVLDGTAHHHLLLFGQPVGISAVHQPVASAPVPAKGLQCRGCSKLSAPIRFRAVDARHVHVGAGILFCNGKTARHGIFLFSEVLTE